ncbi:MAG TPA: hypothetical protein VFD13_02660 [Candidatus Kapabacteria bacterium]|nr:hypothetical protein [Candidatus Kapabacteria bacterium]
MKTLMAILLTAALLPAASFAQGRGHAYGHLKHEERFEGARPGPAVRVYTYSRPQYYVAPAPRVYYYRPRPSISFSFPFGGYSTYQPYGTYYYPNGYLAARPYRVIRSRGVQEEHGRRFAHGRRER